MPEEEMLNSKIEFLTRANSMLNPFDPKSGVLFIGDKGLEFRAEKSPGFIQIPWRNMLTIHVQILFKGWYIRGFFIETDDGQTFEFIVSDAKGALRQMRNHLKREQFRRHPSNLLQLFRKNNQRR